MTSKRGVRGSFEFACFSFRAVPPPALSRSSANELSSGQEITVDPQPFDGVSFKRLARLNSLPVSGLPGAAPALLDRYVLPMTANVGTGTAPVCFDLHRDLVIEEERYHEAPQPAPPFTSSGTAQ